MEFTDQRPLHCRHLSTDHHLLFFSCLGSASSRQRPHSSSVWLPVGVWLWGQRLYRRLCQLPQLLQHRGPGLWLPQRLGSPLQEAGRHVRRRGWWLNLPVTHAHTPHTLVPSAGLPCSVPLTHGAVTPYWTHVNMFTLTNWLTNQPTNQISHHRGLVPWVSFGCSSQPSPALSLSKTETEALKCRPLIV